MRTTSEPDVPAARKPDFFIVGGRRCGTTSMWEYLRAHPDVFMPARKEPHYFGTDLNRERAVRSEEEYLALFRDACDERRAGEASTGYLLSTVAAREIHDYAPEASIIAMVRNPVDMLYSLYVLTRAPGGQPLDFASAVTDGPLDPAIARFGEQIDRFVEAFGRDRVHVVVFDDFVRDPETAYAETLRFLGVDDTFRPVFEVHNANPGFRSRRLTALTHGRPFYVRAARRVLPRGLTQRAWQAIYRANRVAAERDPLDPELRRRVYDEVADDVRRLGALLGRDLDALWRPV